MTVYLWYLPAMMLLVGIALAAPADMRPQPGVGCWLQPTAVAGRLRA